MLSSGLWLDSWQFTLCFGNQGNTIQFTFGHDMCKRRTPFCGGKGPGPCHHLLPAPSSQSIQCSSPALLHSCQFLDARPLGLSSWGHMSKMCCVIFPARPVSATVTWQASVSWEVIQYSDHLGTQTVGCSLHLHALGRASTAHTKGDQRHSKRIPQGAVVPVALGINKISLHTQAQPSTGQPPEL